MTTGPNPHVLDTGPLRHFARSQWLGVLKAVLQDTRVLIPDVVAAELRAGVSQHQCLEPVLEADWIEVITLDADEQLAAFAYYEPRLVGPDGRNRGECAVNAYRLPFGPGGFADWADQQCLT